MFARTQSAILSDTHNRGCDVARRRNEGMVEQFAVARAAGQTVRAWSGKHGIAASTVHGWCRLPGFAARVESHRRALVGRELELLAEHHVRRAVTDDPPRAA